VYRRAPGESGFRSPGADRYKLTDRELLSQLRGVAAARPDRPILATELSDLHGRDGFHFLITVDDGGVAYHRILAAQLEERGWRGHAVVSTDFIGQPGFLTAREIRDLDARGHVIGSHSASHPPRFSWCRRQDMLDEWAKSRTVLEDVLGHAAPVASLPG